jgi:hypothetical protein
LDRFQLFSALTSFSGLPTTGFIYNFVWLHLAFAQKSLFAGTTMAGEFIFSIRLRFHWLSRQYG